MNILSSIMEKIFPAHHAQASAGRFHLKAPPNFMEVHHRSGSDVMFT